MSAPVPPRRSPAPTAATVAPANEGPLWERVVGQVPAVTLLRRALAAGRVAHAYAFVGPSGVGRRLTALAFAQAILCPAGGCGACLACRRVGAGQHPDLLLLAPTPPKDNPRGTPSLRITEVRELEHWAGLTPLEGRAKIFILDEADRLTEQAAEALLKTLEEPPAHTHIVLIVANPRALPPTVLSRCQVVRFRPLPEADIVVLLTARGTDLESAAVLAGLCRGQVGRALEMDLADVQARRAAALALLAVPRPALAGRLDEAAPDRGRVAAALETYWLWYRDALCLAAGAEAARLVNGDRRDDVLALARRVPLDALTSALGTIKEAHLALEANVSPRLVLEHALLALAPAA